jgi:PAP2 superfamily
MTRKVANGNAAIAAPVPNWPPYGPVNEVFMYDVRTRRVPVGFRIDGEPASERAYDAWLRELVDEMARFLWPRYDSNASPPWVGKAASIMEALTRADFELMRGLRNRLALAPTGRDATLAKSHMALFLEEDLVKPWPTYALYETKLPDELMARVQESMHKPVAAFGPAPLRFKHLMQRPRPFQMALILGIEDFKYEWAKSAVTPSIISGHSIQAVIAGAGAYVQHVLDFQKVAGSIAHLEQYAVDVGDRRVFAGVHYPSDNLASWYVAIKLCDHYMFGELGRLAKTFLWSAISKRSAVHAAMAEVGGVYAEPLKELARIATTEDEITKAAYVPSCDLALAAQRKKTMPENAYRRSSERNNVVAAP